MKNYLYFLFVLVSIAAFSQTKQVYHIGILQDYRTEKIAPILQQLQDQIKAVVGEDAIIKFSESNMLTNNYNLENALKNYQTLLANETDIIIAFGAVNNIVLTRQKTYAKPTLLFGTVNMDMVTVDMNKKASGITNFTYLIASQSYQRDLEQFKELTDFKNLGIIVEKELIEILPFKETFDKELKGLNANYTLIPFESISDVTSNLEGIDALYMAGGFFLEKQEIEELARLLIAKKIPSFTTSTKEDVLAGIMATTQGENNIDQIIRRIALSIESYISGTNFSELPLLIESTPRLTLNYNTAELVGVPIKYSLINSIDFVGEFVNSISEKQYNLISAINQVLDKNLSLASGKKDVALSNQDLKLTKSNYLPSLTATVDGTYLDPKLAEISQGQNPEFSTGGDITLEQTLFSETLNANITIQKKLLLAATENFNTSQLDAIFDISSAYFTTLILKANAQIQHRNLSLTKNNLAISRQNYDAGSSGKSDVLRFKSEMAQNTQAMVEAINNMEQSYIGLNQLLNNPLDTEIDIEDIDLEKGIFEQYNYKEFANILDNPRLRESFIAFMIAEAKTNSPELKSLDYNIEATNRSVKLYGSGRLLPTVTLRGQYNRNFSRSGAGSTPANGGILLDKDYNVGASISLPIFNQNQNKINRRTALIQKEQLNIGKENSELAIDANIRNAVLSIINQISNIELSKVSESTAEESLELTQIAYATGSINIIQLIDAQNNYLDAQLSRTNAIYNFLIDAIQLERSLGYYFLLNTEEDNLAFRQRFLEYTTNNNNK